MLFEHLLVYCCPFHFLFNFIVCYSPLWREKANLHESIRCGSPCHSPSQLQDPVASSHLEVCYSRGANRIKTVLKVEFSIQRIASSAWVRQLKSSSRCRKKSLLKRQLNGCVQDASRASSQSIPRVASPALVWSLIAIRFRGLRQLDDPGGNKWPFHFAR